MVLPASTAMIAPMPVIFREQGYRFFFYSNEGTPREPIHVHVRKGERLAKYWLEPIFSLVENHGFKGTELREIRDILSRRERHIREAWNDHFDA